jgi:hypothetical protein
MKEGILKTCDKEKEKWYGNLVIHMKVNGNKIKYMAMVFINITVVMYTLEIGNITIYMVMVFITVQMVICLKVNTNMTKKQEYHFIISLMVRFIKTFGLKIECCTQ